MSNAIIIVTHNRLPMLKNCVNGALEQKPDAIFVVDNASTDGTKEYLAQIESRNTCFFVISSSINHGSSFGFGLAMQAAYNRGYEWLWLMDDDVMPVQGALAGILEQAKNIGPCCLIPAKQCADGRRFDYEYSISRKTLRRSRISRLGNLDKMELVPGNSGNFEGMLVHRDIIKKIGLPEKKFFICWDDAFYGMRAAEYFPNYYFNMVCIKKQKDKERLYWGNKGYLGSTLFSRCHFLRNYRHVLNYLQKKGELSSFAYAVYAWECFKSICITLFIEGDYKGLLSLGKAMRGQRNSGL